MDGKNVKMPEFDLSFEEIIKRHEKQEKKVEVETKEEEKLDNFTFEKIMEKNKKPEVKPKQRKQKKDYKYKNYVFKNLQDLSDFFLLEYKDKEKHAEILLNDTEFLEWLETNVNDQDLYKNWVENVLS